MTPSHHFPPHCTSSIDMSKLFYQLPPVCRCAVYYYYRKLCLSWRLATLFFFSTFRLWRNLFHSWMTIVGRSLYHRRFLAVTMAQTETGMCWKMELIFTEGSLQTNDVIEWCDDDKVSNILKVMIDSWDFALLCNRGRHCEAKQVISLI